MLASDTDLVGAYRLAEKLRTTIAEQSLILGDSMRPTAHHGLDRRRRVPGQSQQVLQRRRPGALPRQGERQELRDGRRRGGAAQRARRPPDAATLERAPPAMAGAARAWHAARVTLMVGLSGGIGSGKSTVSRLLAALGATRDRRRRDRARAAGAGLADAGRDRGGVRSRRDRRRRPSRPRRARRDRVPRRGRARAAGRDRPPGRRGRDRAPRGAGAQPGRRACWCSTSRCSSRAARPEPAARRALEFDATVRGLGARSRRRSSARWRATAARARWRVDRVRAQLPLHEKKALADFVIDNSGTPEETERQVRALWETLKRKAPRAAAP